MLAKATTYLSRRSFCTNKTPVFASIPSMDDSVEGNDIKWNLKSAAIVTRVPPLLPDLSKEERQYRKMKYKHDYYHCYHDKKDVLDDSEVSVTETELPPMYDPFTAIIDDGSPNGLKPASRLTENDYPTLNDQSLNRALDRELFLIVRDPANNKNHDWDFPTASYDPTKKLRDVVHRKVIDSVGPRFAVSTWSFQPEGYAAYTEHATKVFFYKFFYDKGTPTLNSEHIKEFKWVTATELKDYFSPEYYEYVKCMLPLPISELNKSTKIKHDEEHLDFIKNLKDEVKFVQYYEHDDE